MEPQVDGEQQVDSEFKEFFVLCSEKSCFVWDRMPGLSSCLMCHNLRETLRLSLVGILVTEHLHAKVGVGEASWYVA